MNKRVTTGIENLDKTIEGGYKKSSINLVEGGPGSGKSIFAMQYLVEGINNQEHGVYITFEEEKQNLIDNMGKFWDLNKYVKKGQLFVVEMSPHDVQEVIEKKSFDLKFKVVKEVKAQRIVIDSVTAYSYLFEDGLKRREALQQLFKTLRDFKCTSLLIAERDITVDKSHLDSDVIEYEVDSIIALYNIRKGDVRERALEVKKIRGTEHTQKIFPMKITEKGIEIYPEQAMF